LSKPFTLIVAVFVAAGLAGCTESWKVVHPKGLPAGTIVPCGRISYPLEFVGDNYFIVDAPVETSVLDVDTGAPVPGPGGQLLAISRDGKAAFFKALPPPKDRPGPQTYETSLWDFSERPPCLVRSWSSGPDDWALAFSPDGKRLALKKDPGVWLCDTDTGSSAVQLTDQSAQPIAFSPDGKILACYMPKPQVGTVVGLWSLWDVDRKVLLRTLDPGFGRNLSYRGTAQFSTDGQTLVVHQWFYPPGPQMHEIRVDAEVVVYEVSSGKELLRAGVADTRRFIQYADEAGDAGHGLAVYDLASGKARRLQSGWPAAVAAGTSLYAAFVPLTSSSGRTRTFALWDLDTGAQLKTLAPGEDWWDCTALSPDGHLFVLSAVSRMKVVDIDTGRTVFELYKPPHGETGTYIGRRGLVVFSPDGKHLVYHIGGEGYIADLDVILKADAASARGGP
jgi:WD40 repeat protein